MLFEPAPQITGPPFIECTVETMLENVDVDHTLSFSTTFLLAVPSEAPRGCGGLRMVDAVGLEPTTFSV